MPMTACTYDVAVIGAGVFGAWTAFHLAKRKQKVVLVEAYGPGHSRASSGGESRIIRMSYGADEIYTRWSHNSLTQWKELFAVAGEKLFHQTQVLWLSAGTDSTLTESIANLHRYGVNHRLFERGELQRLYPQVNFDGVSRGLLETESGVLLARRAVTCIVDSALRQGVQLKMAQIGRPVAAKNLEFIETAANERIFAGNFVFACGAWLGKLFPEILGAHIFPTRQEVFFFATPPGDTRFAPPALPTWLFQADEVYGMPDLEVAASKLPAIFTASWSTQTRNPG